MFDRLGAIAAEHDVRLILAALGVCLLSGVISARLYTQGRRESRFFRNLWIGATGMLAGTGAWATHLLALMAFGPAWGGHYQAVLAASGWLVSTTGATIAVTLAIHQREAQARLAAGAIFGLALCAMAAMGFASLQPLARLQWDGEYISLWGAGAMLTAMGAVWALGRGDGLVWRGLFGVGLTLSVAMVHLAGLTAATATVGPGARVDDLSIGVPVLGAIVIFLLLATTAVSIGAVVISARSQVQALGDLREAINAMPAGLAFYDRDDRCIIWNATYAVVGGQGAPALRPGVTFRELIEAQLAAGDLPDGVGREADYLEERLRSRRESAGPVEQLFGERWLRVEDRRTSTGGTVSIIHDITDLKDIARTVEAARDQAQAANRAKSEFLANMSHELRTPLNGVIGVAQALARTRMTARQREMLQTVQSSALTLQGVLSDLLDLARIESGRLELTCERFSMGAVLKDAASLWRLEAQKKGVEFQLDLGDGAAADVHGDQVRFRQVVVNLLSNAVKFTADGVVAMRAWRDPADPDLLCLSVRDSGIGFPPEVAERLFVRFEQADGSVTRRFGGTGLGLAISRDLVERMGGRIWAEGQPGEGATFHVELPMAALEGLDPAAQGPAWVSAEAMSRPLRVMCAEDHPVNRKVVEFILEAAGVELVCAVDGREAVELFRTQRFDAILMDMQMPVMDGLSATQEIRRIEAEEGLQRTPVIMVTANAMPEHLASSQAAGADDHLTKPIAADKLMSMLERVTADALFAEAEAA